jgi:hypothetical protein
MSKKDSKTEQPCTIHDVSCCCFCGAKIKNESNSLHVWEIEYECGYKICGAIDVETHGDGIMVDTECSNCN